MFPSGLSRFTNQLDGSFYIADQLNGKHKLLLLISASTGGLDEDGVYDEDISMMFDMTAKNFDGSRSRGLWGSSISNFLMGRSGR